MAKKPNLKEAYADTRSGQKAVSFLENEHEKLEGEKDPALPRILKSVAIVAASLVLGTIAFKTGYDAEIPALAQIGTIIATSAAIAVGTVFPSKDNISLDARQGTIDSAIYEAERTDYPKKFKNVPKEELERLVEDIKEHGGFTKELHEERESAKQLSTRPHSSNQYSTKPRLI